MERRLIISAPARLLLAADHLEQHLGHLRIDVVARWCGVFAALLLLLLLGEHLKEFGEEILADPLLRTSELWRRKRAPLGIDDC